MNIEHYQSKDEEAVLNIWLKASEQAHAFAGGGFLVRSGGRYEAGVFAEARTWICRDGDRVMGFAAWWERGSWPPCLWIRNASARV